MSDLDITKIPTIMRANNWTNGAKLMEKWFASKANAKPALGLASTDIIKMSWVLRYSRAKLVYDKLVKEKVWINNAAKKEIIRMLKRKMLLSQCEEKFGVNNMPLPIVDNDSIQFRVVGGSWDMATGAMDDLRAALANFVFKMVVIGKVEPIFKINPAPTKLTQPTEKTKKPPPGGTVSTQLKVPTGEYKVTIKKVGIYVKDSYDFNDAKGEDQSLGNWDFDDNSVGRTLFNGGEKVKNSDFRTWRQENKKGGDFLVYSDIIYIKQHASNVFIFKK